MPPPTITDATHDPGRIGTPALELEDVGREHGDRPALEGVTLRLAAGRTLAVVGPNGAGKSTLLRVLATLLRPSAGRAVVLGAELPREGHRLRPRIGYLGHEPLLYRELSGRENLRFHARLHGLTLSSTEQRSAWLLERLEMTGRADDPVGELSRGMVQRLAICRALLGAPELLLADEPLSHLDPRGAELATPLLGSVPGRTRVVVTHDLAAARAEADTLLALVGGRVGYLGPAPDDDRHLREAFASPPPAGGVPAP